MKWILLDAMGVVYRTGDDTNDLLIPFIQSKNDYINRHLIQTLYLDASLGKISSEKFWELLGFKDQFPEIEKYYLDNYILLDNGISDFLEMLDTKTYKVAMLSNDVNEWSIYLRRKFNIEHYFGDFIISGDVNFRKPDFDIFNIALSKLKANAEDCIFVDDRVKNLESAFALGFNTIFFDRENIGAEKIGQFKYVNSYVNNFNDLMPIIKSHFERSE